ncbi:MAG TPA: hypothetical protein VFE58_14535 [Tepidisphaeraceae bacterium]|jgi:hypothetical protein|nr:hypothetical protein [Tepidisphaeraceae bacterium]
MTETNSLSTSPLLTAYHRARILLALAALVAFALFTGATRLLHIPVDPGHSVSLLQQPSPVVPLIAILVLLILSALIGSVIAGSVRRDAGLLAACLGLVAVTVRGGTIAATLQSATSPAVYSSLAIELLLLYTFILLAYFALAPLRSSHFLLPDHLHDGLEPHPDPQIESLGNKLLATASQVLGMLLLMLLLAQSPDKVQSLAAVFLAAMLATAAAHSAFPVEPSIYFWIGPGIVGIIGYAYASVSPGPWLIGLPANPLASPIPLDYAAAGTPGALLGYWMSRRWQRARESTIVPPADAHMPMG